MLLMLAEKITRDCFSPDIILAVSRGGYAPARVISDILGKAEMASVRVQFYSNIAKTNKKPVITQPISTPVHGKKVLVVDDVADTGKSLSLVKQQLEKGGASSIKIATLYKKPWSMIVPDYYVKETDAWIAYPWEWFEFSRSMFKKLKAEGKSPKEIRMFLNRLGIDRKITSKIKE
jgi:hypoxanthine phosphoribosyltransferase